MTDFPFDFFKAFSVALIIGIAIITMPGPPP
jgi:hypothetical protein